MRGKRIGQLKSKWTSVHGWQLHARVSSSPALSLQSPVLLIHGLLISSRYMVPTAKLLGRHYPVYALDMPGFGKSEGPHRVLTMDELADTIVAWMDVMQLPRAIMLGNSLGGQVLINLAARYPARVEQLILVGPTVDPQARTVIQQASRLLIDFVLEHPSLLYHLLIDAVAAGVRRTWQTFQYALDEISEQQLHAIHAPTLVVRGARDPVAPQRWAEEIVQRLPDGQLQVIPKGPHCVNYSTPAALVAAVQHFLHKQLYTSNFIQVHQRV